MPRVSLKPDPLKAESRGAGERPTPVVQETAMSEVVGEHQLTPSSTKSCGNEGDAINYQMEAAKKSGLRAPIILGGQGVYFFMAAIWGHGRQQAELDIYFDWPVFWDDTIAVGVSSDMSAVASIREDKVLTKMKVNSRSEL